MREDFDPRQVQCFRFVGAEYAGGDIVCEPGEIADARWFHYRELPMIPPPSSVSGQLIRHYVDNL